MHYFHNFRDRLFSIRTQKRNWVDEANLDKTGKVITTIISIFGTSVLAKYRFGARQILRKAALFLLPLVLIASFSMLAPTPAFAQTTGPKDGMFDCLGDYDWGCQVIGYLFEDKGLTTNSYESSSVQGALKAMMGFFSNAMLIVASLILLFELIKMVAETAHSGVVGGKDTNQVWAPIRLVLAIGLLVPLSSGMNSGQYIVVQLAKWGSGLGSQAWKVFITNLSENQRLVPPRAPAIKDLLRNTLKIYVCKAMNDHFARFDVDKIALRTTTQTTTNNNSGLDTIRTTLHFDRPLSDGGDFCGSIEYVDFSGDNPVSDALKVENATIYKSFLPQIESAAEKIRDDFLSSDKKYEKVRNIDYLNDLLNKYQTQTNQRIQSIGPDKATQNFKLITQVVKNEANLYGWMSAGTWFLAISRAQGELGDYASTIPTANINTGHVRDSNIAGNSLASAYKQFNDWMDTSPAQIIAGKPSSYGVNESSIQPIESGGDNDTEIMDWIFETIDILGVRYGLWVSTCKDGMTDLECKRAWSDVSNRMLNFGDTTNPFAELANMGHNKIRAAIGFFEKAILFAGFNVVASFLGFVPGASAVGHFSLLIASLFTFIAAGTMLAGVILAFFVPLMPYYRFFFAIVNWLGSIVEAIILIPILALAQLSPRGPGLMGERARHGYYTIFQILVRPTLTVFGLIVALLIFYVMVKILNYSYYDAVLSNGFFPGSAGMVARIIYSILHVVMVYSCANIAFKMIDIIPSKVHSWIGRGMAETKHEDEGTINQAQAAITGYISSEIIPSPTRLGQQIKPPSLR